MLLGHLLDGTIEKCQDPDYIINLAGAGIADQRWTEKGKMS